MPGVKGRKPTARRVSFDEIAKARVELEFNRKSDKRDAQQDEKIDENDENKEEA